MTKSFRVWDKDLCKYITGAEFGLARMSIRPDEDDGRIFSFDTLFPGRYTWEQDTGLKDKNGKEIYGGDILRFDDDNGIWQAPVTFERGLFGLDVHHPKQVKNPDGWDKDYDKVESRGWAVQWGYEETGTAFTYRTPLAKATIFRGSPEEYEKSEQKKLYEKFGYGDYYVMAEVIGNIYENPELLNDDPLEK